MRNASQSLRMAVATKNSFNARLGPIRKLTTERPKIRPLIAIFVAGALGAAAYGTYAVYASATTWPQELRIPLRQAVRAQNSGDLQQSAQYFRDAWHLVCHDTKLADSLGLSKTSGIAASFGAVLELLHKPQDAVNIYDSALQRMMASESTWSNQETLRAVSLAQRIGLLSEAFEPELAEKRLSWAVTTLLRAVVNRKRAQQADFIKDTEASAVPSSSSQDSLSHLMSEQELPSWISRESLGASLENLGMLYLARQNAEYATPLLFRALTLLLPSKAPPGSPNAPTLSDRCHAATIANNLSSAFALNPVAGSADLRQAQTWADNAIHIARTAIHEAEFKRQQAQVDECQACLAAGLFNKGSIFELQGDKAEAKKSFIEALEQARSHKLSEAFKQVLQALNRV